MATRSGSGARSRYAQAQKERCARDDKTPKIDHDSNMITLYHGDKYQTKSIENSLMFNGNNQEGVGIYFGSKEIAESYGFNIVSIDIDKTKFVASRESMADEVADTEEECGEKVYSLLLNLHNRDKENIKMYQLLNDYGLELSHPSEVNESLLYSLSEILIDEEVRNFQILMVEMYGVEKFAEAWKETFPDIVGTYSKETGFYAVLDNSIPVTQIGNHQKDELREKIESTKEKVKEKTSPKKSANAPKR